MQVHFPVGVPVPAPSESNRNQTALLTQADAKACAMNLLTHAVREKTQMHRAANGVADKAGPAGGFFWPLGPGGPPVPLVIGHPFVKPPVAVVPKVEAATPTAASTVAPPAATVVPTAPEAAGARGGGGASQQLGGLQTESPA
jgi:hypothetical protein